MFSALVVMLFQYASALGFSSADHFTAATVYGQVVVDCQNAGEMTTATFQCQTEKLQPVEYDYFAGPAGVSADQINLTVRHPDGSTVSKSSSYDSQRFMSSSRFNLWIQTLFQTPLLDVGNNDITYELVKNNTVVSRGGITVPVTWGNTLYCPSSRIMSIDMNDCQSQFSACQRYFSQQANCH